MFSSIRAVSGFFLLVGVIAFAWIAPVNAQQKVDQATEFKGRVVGPIEFGQPTEGAGLKAYGLKLAKPITLNDQALCGEQSISILPIESELVKAYVGKVVVLRATPYCRVSRTGKYHLKDVSIQ